MTTLFASLALDIAVPLAVLLAGVVASETVFVAGDLLLTMRRRAA
ncbi:hypothetical protein [Shinella pollutisoli]|uniref:Uncharacterized protein n=1 Tax=Shinella pollutisoli TaxID=2250594 RepID=A0ABV7DAI6_9HYPH|nr:hypothetical protein [Shinella pollutisoli]